MSNLSIVYSGKGSKKGELLFHIKELEGFFKGYATKEAGVYKLYIKGKKYLARFEYCLWCKSKAIEIIECR